MLLKTGVLESDVVLFGKYTASQAKRQ